MSSRCSWSVRTEAFVDCTLDRYLPFHVIQKGTMVVWKAVTTVVDRIGLCEHRQILMHRIHSHFNIPYTGVVIVLEKEDYQTYHNHVWRQTAVHLNIQVGGLEEMSPEHLLTLMRSQDYSNLIWLSKQACEARDICFAWILTHELRHLEQDLWSHTLSRAGRFLNCTLGRINMEEPQVQNAIPTELDANLCAWRVGRRVFGAEIVDTHVQNAPVGDNSKQSFQILRSHDPDKAYDVFGCTKSLLQKYQSQFKELQKQSEDKFIATFDIDKACSELSRRPNSVQ